MKVGIVGLGYVGLIQSIGLAKLGHQVYSVDISVDRVNKLKNNQSPIHEDGLEALLQEVGVNIKYSNDINLLSGMDFIFICVGTPQDSFGKTDLSYIKSAANDLRKILKGDEVVVIKSTVPVDTNKMVYEILEGKNEVVSNPEFLREGQAIKDFFEPEKVVLGFRNLSNSDVINKTKKLYKYFVNNDVDFVITNTQTAELIKYACNAFLANKISFINEIAKLSDKIGANVKDVANGMGLDSRIGNKFLNAGLGYGGSCFPKDVRSLIWQFEENDVDSNLISSIDEVNSKQIDYFIDKIFDKLGDISGKKIALMGVAFKPDTDDIRESRGVIVFEKLLERGAYINVFDYNIKALDNFRSYVKHLSSTRYDIPVNFYANFEDCLKDTEVVVLTLEDKRFNSENWEDICENTSNKILFDGKNILNDLNKKGLEYIGVGV